MARAIADAPRTDVCGCPVPRFTGPCRCNRRVDQHMPGECLACHRPILNDPTDSCDSRTESCSPP